MKKNTDNNIIFSDIIEYDEVFGAVVYITNNNLIDTKLYDTDTFDVTTPKKGVLNDNYIYPHSLRKLIFSKQSGSGIVIGEKVLREGHYIPGNRPSGFDFDDYEQAYLEVSKQYSFWVVATRMNTTILVPKK